MAVQTVNPGSDDFADLFAKFNDNAEAIPTSAAVDAGAALKFYNYLTSLLATAQLPEWEDRIQGGLTVTVTGAGPYSATYLAGTFAFDSQTYVIGAGGAVAIGAADATNDRIDVVYVDTLLNVAIQAGTPAATPSVPALGAGQLAIAYLYVFAAPTGLAPVATPALRIVDGTTRGRVAAWNGYQYAETSSFRAPLNRTTNTGYVDVDLNIPRLRLTINQGSNTATVDLSQTGLFMNCGFQRRSKAVAFADSPYDQQPIDNLLLVNTSAGAVVINLQDSPNQDYEVTIADAFVNASANNITINAGAGATINDPGGATTAYVISTDGGAVTLHWVSADSNWVITSKV